MRTSHVNSAVAPMGASEWLILFFLSAVWGGSFFFVEIAIDAWPPLTIVALRLSGGAIVLWMAALVTGARPPRDIGLWAAIIVMALFNNVLPFSLLAWGQKEIASGLAAILNATTPLFTAVLAGAFLPDERMTPSKVAGIALGVIGVMVMVGSDIVSHGDNARMMAILACIAAALSYAVAAIFGRRFAKAGVAPLVTAAGQVSAGAILLILFICVSGYSLDLGAGSGRHWAAAGGLAFLSTGLAYGLFFKLLATSGATNITLVTILIPVYVIILGVSFLGERLLSQHIVGLVIFALALVVIDGRAFRKRDGAKAGCPRITTTGQAGSPPLSGG